MESIYDPKIHEVTLNWKFGERGEKASFIQHHSWVRNKLLAISHLAQQAFGKPRMSSCTFKARRALRWMSERNRESVCMRQRGSNRKGRQRQTAENWGGRAELQSVACIKIYFLLYIYIIIYVNI